MTTATFFGAASGSGGGAATHVSGLTYVSKAGWVVGVEAPVVVPRVEVGHRRAEVESRRRRDELGLAERADERRDELEVVRQ